MSFTLKIGDRSAVIGVIGLGYVGLPLILSYSRHGFHTIGFDIDPAKVAAVREGLSYIRHIPSDQILAEVSAGRLAVTTDFSKVSEVDAIIICVPTPLGRHHDPDLSFVEATVDALAPHLQAGQIVSLESTTYPGTTEEIVRPRLEANGFRIGEDLFLVYSPEREDPGNRDFAGTAIPKVLGGSTAACTAAGQALYGAIYPAVVPVSSTAAAEFTKLLENIYRAVNIGLVNELKIVADAMKIDIWEVIRAASSKPFGFTPFYPGPGLGGHCIPIDPFYLTWKAREYGIHTRFIELAGQINESMPEYVVRRIADALNERSTPLKGSRILLLGLAYKPDVDDMRESPTFRLMDLLTERGAEVRYHDPYIPIITPTREHARWTGQRSVQWNEEELSGADCVVVATHHACFNLEQLVAWAPLVADTRNALAASATRPGQVVKT
ncbi:MAG TPA: nucleotide sugar dehydrogenase [Verrucomicrobiales bacterium]|nr:nucleotide sugar dehydrogenase [Verrucomicrobiales bacterium]